MGRSLDRRGADPPAVLLVVEAGPSKSAHTRQNSRVFRESPGRGCARAWRPHDLGRPVRLPQSARVSIAVPGRNCWCRPRADRVGLLVDAAAYFDALASAIERAEHSVLIIGWSVHSRLLLRRKGRGSRSTLGELLNRAAWRRPGLHVHVLLWDFAMLYALEREPPPVFQLGWRTHRRVHFRLDSEHPLGGSHHQKLVVVDDAVAFSGGIDLTATRWDTPEHRPDDPRRLDPRGQPYPPVHDVQLVVDADAAAALGELARERWTRATGEHIEPPPRSHADPWPPTLLPDLERVRVAIARTEPAWRGRDAVREVEALHLDTIAAARREIYFENQYLTAHRIGEALAERLAEEAGPELVIVTPGEARGWLGARLMQALRARQIRRLRAADAHGHLRLLAPWASDAKTPIYVHAKLVIADGMLLRVGSANLANRSMGLDSELDLCIEAEDDPSAAAAIGRLRDRLLAEHLGVTEEAVAEERLDLGSLVSAVDALAGGSPRTLRSLPDQAEEAATSTTWLSLEQKVADPERPLEADLLLEEMLGEEEPLWAQFTGRTAATLAALTVLGVIWHVTPIGRGVGPREFASAAQALQESGMAPLLVAAAFVGEALLPAPATPLVVLSVLWQGVSLGLASALLGASASALVGFGLGRLVGRERLRRFAGTWLNRLGRRLAGGGARAVVAARLGSGASFALVNFVAGAARVAPRDFALGTVGVVVPLGLLLGLLTDGIVRAVRSPDARNVAVAVVLVAALALAGSWLRRPLRRAAAPPSATSDATRSRV
jgi:phospholipase D1/2